MLLLNGVLGLQLGRVFGSVSNNMPIDKAVFGRFSGTMGLVLIAVFAYRIGVCQTTIIFIFFAMFDLLPYCNSLAKSHRALPRRTATGSSSWHSRYYSS